MADLLNEKDQLMALEKLLREQKAAAALELAQKLLKEFPDSFQIKFTHARVLRATGQLPQAEAELLTLVPAHRGHLNLLLELATLSVDMKKDSQAVEYYNQALFIDPFNKRAKEALAELKEKAGAGSKTTQPELGRQAYEQEKKSWQADTLPEEEIGNLANEEKWPDDDGDEDEPVITHESIRVEDELEPMKPSIPGVDEAYIEPESIRVEGRKEGVDPALEESLMPDPDFLAQPEPEDRVTTDDVADALTGGGKKSRSEPASARKPADLRAEPGLPLDGDEFITESAARLYLSQGLYEEALYIYQQLHRRQPEDKFARKIEELKSKCHCQKKIQALTAFLKLIQERGG